ncbi:hypothetical protein [Caldicellulosiruptor naganoensis]|uniref:Uncharacterized protein n=1 Tax=Caldicellulosiruptor naganoensis TaxID=29324 RepID=A0ABY7BLC9_9FIRM|nr:hypothetical protein [Caldicellulosiruptor naganoensis]WAM31831.1 hypothetical protein OTJ99_000299 [Caldicellulosiruptor naganoensis]
MNGNEHIHYPMIIVKNKPFSQLESKKLKETADKGKIVPLYIPYVNDKEPLYHIKQGHLTSVEF